MKLFAAILVSAAGALTAISSQAQMKYSGSDTVAPVVEAARSAFQRGHPDFKLQLQGDGSSVGLKELCAGGVMLAGSSRPMTSEERTKCTVSGIKPMEIPVAVDGVALIVSHKNTWLTSLKYDEVRTLFSPASSDKLNSWRLLRPSLPDQPLKTGGVGIKHGTFQFLSEALGNRQFVRLDFKEMRSHADTAKWVAADAGAIGFVPLAAVGDFESQVRAVPIDFGKGPIEPSAATLRDGRYMTLGRTVYLYVNPAVAGGGKVESEFVKILLDRLEKYVSYSGLTPLPSAQYQESFRRAGFKR